MPKSQLSLVILAGGQGRRMGRPKAALPFQGRPMLTHILARLSGLTDDCIVVTRDGRAPVPLPKGVRLVKDLFPGQGPLSAAVAGLRKARYPVAAILSCDLPLVSPQVLDALTGLLTPPHEAAVPVISRRPQPLHAIYRATPAAKAGLQALTSGTRSMQSLLALLDVRWVREADLSRLPRWRDSFANVNTPGDLSRAWGKARGATRPPAPTSSLSPSPPLRAKRPS